MTNVAEKASGAIQYPGIAVPWTRTRTDAFSQCLSQTKVKGCSVHAISRGEEKYRMHFQRLFVQNDSNAKANFGSTELGYLGNSLK